MILDIRTAIFELHEERNLTPRFRAALATAIRELTADISMRTTVRMVGPLDVVPGALAENGMAVVREAVSNAVRHSGAAKLRVIISVADELVIDVTDDGVGIPDTVTRSGLRNMARRAADSGGSCIIERPETGGTRLLWSAPMPE